MMEISGVRGIHGRDPSRDGERMAAFGEMDDALRIEIFDAVMADVFLPGLGGLGIEGGPAREWLEALKSGE